MAAIEFSLILPVLLTLLLGFIELVNSIENGRKVILLARTAADLTSQGDTQNPISADTMADIYAAMKVVLDPFDVTQADIDISAIGVGVQGASLQSAYVCSAWSNGTSPRATGPASDIVVPLNYQRLGARYVLAEVNMPYKPILGAIVSNVIKGIKISVDWKESVSWPVRGGESYSSSSDNEIRLNATGKKCP